MVALYLSGCASAPPPREAGSVHTVAPPSDPPTSPQVVAQALSLTGLPYRDGGASPAVGFDCSGLVHYLARQQGLALPRDARSMAATLPAIQWATRRPGDLLFFNTRGHPQSHVGIYLGSEGFIHAASRRSGGVRISDLRHHYWRARLTGLRRPPWP